MWSSDKSTQLVRAIPSSRWQAHARPVVCIAQDEIAADLVGRRFRAQPGHRFGRPLGRNMNRRIELANWIDAGRLDGHLHIGCDCARTQSDDTYACIAILFVSALR